MLVFLHFLFFFTTLLRYKCISVNCTYLKSTMWSILTDVYTHETITTWWQWIFTTSNSFFKPFWIHFSFLPWTWANIDLLSVTIYLLFFRILYEWSPTACAFLGVGYFCFSITQSCPTLCSPMDCSTPGLPVHHQLLELTQTPVHWVGDAIQRSHSLSPPSPPVLNLPQHQGPFQWVGSLYQVARVLEFQLQHQSFQWVFRTDFL